MTTDLLRRRLDALTDAIAHVDDRLDDIDADPVVLGTLRESLVAEANLLTTADADEVSDASAEIAFVAWLSALSVGQIVAAAEQEPVSRALQRPPRVTVVIANALRERLRGQGTAVSDLRLWVGDDIVDDLVAIARAARLALPADERPYLWRDVAVMLPLRLETLFDQDDVGEWTMLLRIIPDEASVLRHTPWITTTEKNLVIAMWTLLHDTLTPDVVAGPVWGWLSDERAAGPWQTLCRQVGGPRAAWLAGAHPPTIGPEGTITLDTEASDDPAEPNRIGGLPERIEIWCAFGGDPALLTTTELIDTDALRFDVIGADATADGELVEQDQRWWVSWKIAKQVGLGVEHPLPDGLTPSDITAIYAVGVGSESPADHFACLVDSGEVARLPLGVATNSVNAEQTASLGTDPTEWREVARRRLEQGPDSFDSSDVALPLTGDFTALAPIPGVDNLYRLDRLLVGALWPALWGHHLRDVWGFESEADTLALWAATYLAPEGPLPPLRISEQPYGLLPTSAMDRWTVGPDDDGAACEPRMLDTLLRIRDVAADAAAGPQHTDAGNPSAPTAIGADTPRLLELIAHDGVSSGYRFRPFLPAETWKPFYTATGVAAGDFDDAVATMIEPGKALFGQGPARSYLGTSTYDVLDIPLVVPTRWPLWFWTLDENGDILLDDKGDPIPAMPVEEGMSRLLHDLTDKTTAYLPFNWYAPGAEGLLPDSLLIRLLWHSKLLAEANVVLAHNGITSPMLDDYGTLPDTLLRTYAEQFDPAIDYTGSAADVLRNLTHCLIELNDIVVRPGVLADLERTLAATVDTATHRVDPWLTGMAARRLEALSRGAGTRYRLGAYGWLEGPVLGQAGPTAGGLLYAPSHAQALTAAIVRDRHLSAEAEDPGQADRWSMQLESSRIRLADDIAEEIRIGCHPYEAIGRQVERVIASADDVDVLRERFPLRLDRPDAARVCHGLEALQNLLSEDPTNPPVVTIGETRLGGLRRIRDALDTHSDLQVAESVYQVVCGRADIAGAALDSASGLGTPPSLSFIETPLAAETLQTAVIAAVPATAPSADAGPATTADPSVAAAVRTLVADAAEWEWYAEPVPGGESVTLHDLGLDPIDATLLRPELLDDLAAYRLGSAIDPDRSTGPQFLRQATQFVRTLGTQPAFFADITSAHTIPDAATLDEAITRRLLDRYATLRDAASALVGRLEEVTVPADGQPPDPAELGKTLHAALRWGVLPVLEPAERDGVFAALLGNAQAADTDVLVQVATSAHDALKGRLAAAPLLPPPDDPKAHQAVRAPETLGRAIAELAAPDGRLAVLADVAAADVVRMTGNLAPDTDLDDQWLTVVASVRPELARLEAAQLAQTLPADSVAALAPWSNSPGDHWQTAALQQHVAARDQGVDPGGSIAPLVAAYSAADLLDPDARIAIGLIDSWSESVPRPVQTSTAAFGFNAPAARAPQAILVAVPPDLTNGFGVELTTPELVDIVADTAHLARARAARADAMGDLQVAIGTANFQGHGRLGMRLDSDVAFP